MTLREAVTRGEDEIVPICIALTETHREVLATHGPYTLRDDGVIVDRNGMFLTDCRPNAGSEECDWDRALVALLNEITIANRPA